MVALVYLSSLTTQTSFANQNQDDVLAPTNISLSQRPWGYYPNPLVPSNNPLTDAKVALGKRLFAESALSITGQYSCASCHQPDNHFTDGLPRAVGATGEKHSLNTPTLYNTAFNASYGWQDEGLTSLEQQHMVPLTNSAPVEMGYSPHLLTKLANNQDYKILFAAAFSPPGTQTVDLLTTKNVVRALACYVRTLVAPPSAFDDFLFNDNRQALSANAQAGMTLFFSERLGCSKCHASLGFSGSVVHAVQQAQAVFHVTGVGESKLAFRAPTLRQISNTAPYMHDGSLRTLEDVINHYENANEVRLETFSLTGEQRAALVEFLRAL